MLNLKQSSRRSMLNSATPRLLSVHSRNVQCRFASFAFRRQANSLEPDREQNMRYRHTSNRESDWKRFFII